MVDFIGIRHLVKYWDELYIEKSFGIDELRMN